MQKRMAPGKFLLAISLFCSVSLLLAYCAQYFFHLSPCILCTYQRYVLGAILLVALAGILFRNRWRRRGKYFALLASCLFAVNMGISGYQVLIEQKLVEPPSVCKAPSLKAQTIGELRQKMQALRFVPCDEPQWSFMGISIAGYNFLASFMMLLFCMSAMRRFNIRMFGVK